MKKNNRLNRKPANTMEETTKTEMPSNFVQVDETGTEPKLDLLGVGVTEPEEVTEPSPEPVIEPVTEQATQPPVYQMPKPVVMTIEEKIKMVEDLNRLSIQRENLIVRQNQLREFEISVAEDADELEENSFHNCKLMIMDDRGRQFVVKSPGLITMVVGFIGDACQVAKEKIEEKIIFPAA